jgi:hypothetical protein
MIRYTAHAYGYLSGNGNPHGDRGPVTFTTLRGLLRILNHIPYAVPSYIVLHVDRETERVIHHWISQRGGHCTSFAGRLTPYDIDLTCRPEED